MVDIIKSSQVQDINVIRTVRMLGITDSEHIIMKIYKDTAYLDLCDIHFLCNYYRCKFNIMNCLYLITMFKHTMMVRIDPRRQKITKTTNDFLTYNKYDSSVLLYWTKIAHECIPKIQKHLYLNVQKSESDFVNLPELLFYSYFSIWGIYKSETNPKIWYNSWGTKLKLY